MVPVLQGNTTDIMFLIAEGYYVRSFNDDGKLILVNQDTQAQYLPTEEVEHILEVLWGHEQLEGQTTETVSAET